MIRALLPLAASVLALSACTSGKHDKDSQSDRDPAVTGALSDPILTDPDLASQNRGGAALGGGGPAIGEVPPFKQGVEETERAKDEALKLAGGSLLPVLAAAATVPASPRAKAVTLPALAVAVGLASQTCANGLGYSALWAAKMSPALAIYPRGHVTEGAGSDEPGCNLRAVTFVTPVGIADVLAYYNTRAKAAGWPVHYRREGTDDVIRSARNSAGFVLLVRRAESGMTEVDLVTSGI